MTQKIIIDKLNCLCSDVVSTDKVAYILYPMDILKDWVDAAARKYGTTIVVITGMDWQNVFSPWPAPGVPSGTPDFEGESPQFLQLLQQKVLPTLDKELNLTAMPERTLVGVSMSGLFALWQWMVCDTFTNIMSLSGSFWYEGFINWIKKLTIPHKSGKGYFLLGNQESKSKVQAFNSVAADTLEIFKLLQSVNIDVEFEIVPGNHYSNPIPRLEKAFSAIYKTK